MPLRYIWRTPYHKLFPEPLAFNRSEFLLQDYYATANTSPFVNSSVLNMHRGHPPFWRFSRRAETHSKLDIGILWQPAVHGNSSEASMRAWLMWARWHVCMYVYVHMYACVWMFIDTNEERALQPPYPKSAYEMRGVLARLII